MVNAYMKYKKEKTFNAGIGSSNICNDNGMLT